MSEPSRPVSTDRHTPGPWSNERIWDTPDTRIHARVEGVPMALAEVFTMRNAGEKEANARLIAAAPELYECCKDIASRKDLLCDCDDPTCATKKLFAAIAKAEGRW